MIQKIREAERDALYDEYAEQIGDMVSGVIQRYEGGAATVALGNVEAILPRSEQIPGETHHVNERVRATVFEVRKSGQPREGDPQPHPAALVQRLFEQEIPEIADGVIEIRAMAREPGYRSKVAVSSAATRASTASAPASASAATASRTSSTSWPASGSTSSAGTTTCEVLIPNALQPAEVEQVILCQMLGRAIVLVREDQLSLAIGRRGQNVRLASKLCGWDIEIMTHEELAEAIDRAVDGFSSARRRDDRAGRAARRGRLPELRRPVGHRARRPDGDGRPDRRSRRTRSSSRPKSGPRRPKRRPPKRAARSASKSGSPKRRPKPA